MSQFSPDSKALFGAARRDFEPTSDDRKRVGRKLGTRLGSAVLAGSATAGAAGATAGVTSTGSVAGATIAAVGKWLGVGLLIGVSAASSYVAFKAPPARPAALVASNSAPTPLVRLVVSGASAPLPAPPATGMSSAESHVSATPSVGSPPRAISATPAAPGAPSTHVGAEAALLRRADAALRAGDANRALSLLREHALHYPAGILAEESSAELVTTLCRLGRTGEARAEAERFLRRTPGSPLAASVRASCAGDERTVPR